MPFTERTLSLAVILTGRTHSEVFRSGGHEVVIQNNRCILGKLEAAEEYFTCVEGSTPSWGLISLNA